MLLLKLAIIASIALTKPGAPGDPESQRSICDSVKSGVFIIKNSNRTPNKAYTSRIVGKLAEANGISLFSVECKFYYSILPTIKKSGDKYHVVLKVKSDSCGGNVNYMGIPIGPSLLPGKMSGRFFISGPNAERISSFDLSDVSIYGKTTTVFDTVIVSSGSQPADVTWNDLIFYYDETSIKTFDSKAQLIDYYFDVSKNLPGAFEKLKAIDASNTDMVTVNDIRLDEIEVVLNEIDEKKLEKNLSLDQTDPAGFVLLFDKVKLKARNLRKRINEMLIYLDKEFYNSAVQSLSAGDTAQAIEYFNKSLLTNKFYHQSRIACARTLYFKNMADSASAILNQAAGFQYIPAEDLKGLVGISKVIYFHIVNDGNALLEKEKYNEAETEYNKAKDFCSASAFFPCDDAWKTGMTKAKYGIFKSYLNIATNATNNQKWKFAIRYIDFAKEYQNKNAEYLGSYNDADILLTRLYEKYIELGDAERISGNYFSAIEYYNRAIEFCKEHKALCSERVFDGIRKSHYGVYSELLIKAKQAIADSNVTIAENLIQQAAEYQALHPEIESCSDAEVLLGTTRVKAYNILIQKGKALLSEGKALEAFYKFTDARNLEKSYIFERDSALPGLIAVTIKPYMFSIAKRADFYIWKSQLDSAQAIIDEITSLSERFNYSSDTALLGAITVVSEKLFEKRCTYVQIQFNKLFYQAKNLLTDLNYLESTEAIDQALKQAALYPACNVDVSEAVSEKQKIKKPATYQFLQRKFAENLTAFNYDEANLYYMESESYFAIDGIANYKLQHVPFNDFVSRNSNVEYVNSTLDFLIRKKLWTKTMVILKKLAERGYPTNYMRDAQIAMADYYAAKDQTLETPPDVDSSITERTGDHPRLKVFARKYKYFRLLYKMGLKKVTQD
ncbi:MAG: hypothetical protein KKD31_14400 [Bacteroidetes bacterium]|nr:hypothetical protein [Bacteroidota bacterium]